MSVFTPIPLAALLLATSLTTGTAFAADPTQPEAIARATVMKDIAKNSKILGDMAGGKTAWDDAAAGAAKTALQAASAGVDAAFMTEGEKDPVSEALPAIWTSWDDFVAKSAALQTAAAGLDTGSAEALKASMAAVGGSCKACHSTYRE